MTDLNYIRVPRALDGLEPLALDMAEIRSAERRLGEVAFTNTLRAPELLALFNGAYLITSRYINLLEYELDLAERRYAETKAVFLLDKLPELLAAKGLATSRSPLGSEDVRQAFLDRDPDCHRVQELISTIRCYIGLLETQQKGFENAYNSVKKLVGSDGRSDFRQNPNLIQPLVPTTGLAERPSQDITPKLTSSAVDDDFFGNPQ